MEYREAIKVLLQMLEKRTFEAHEKEAITTALGALDWASLGKNRARGIIKARKARREKDLEL